MECEAIDRDRCHFSIDENKLQKYFHIMKKRKICTSHHLSAAYWQLCRAAHKLYRQKNGYL